MKKALKITGHGLLYQYSCCLNVSRPVSLAEVLDRLGISGELRDSIVALKDRRPLVISDTVAAGDEIDLFVQLCGG